MRQDKERGGREARARVLAWMLGVGLASCTIAAFAGDGDDEHILLGVAGGFVCLLLWVYVGLFVVLIGIELRRRGRSLPRATRGAWLMVCAGILGAAVSGFPKATWNEWQFERARAWVDRTAKALDRRLQEGDSSLDVDLAQLPSWASEGRFQFSCKNRWYAFELVDAEGGWWHWTPGTEPYRTGWWLGCAPAQDQAR